MMNAPAACRLRTVALMLAAAAAGPLAVGCTPMVWTPATQEVAVRPEVTGVVRNYPDRGLRSLVVTYRARGDGTDVNLAVPLDDAGRPTSPFAAEAFSADPGVAGYIVRYPDATDGGPVAGRVGADHLSALLAHARDPVAERAGLGRHFTAAEFTPAVGPAVGRPVYPDGTERPGTACLLAYRFDDAGQVVRVAVGPTWGTTADPIHLPAGTRVVLVPADVERPPGDQGRDQAAAVALTPAAVAGDAAAVGVGIGLAGVVIGVAIVIAPVVLVAEALAPAKPAAGTKEPTTAPAAEAKPDGPVTVPVIVDGGGR